MTGQCPVTQGFSPFSPAYLADPYPFFNSLREETPVAHDPKLNLYLVTRYEDVVQVLKDRDTFSAANATIPFLPIAPEARAILETGFPRKPTFTNCDPPRHPRMRHVAARCLSTRRWAATEPLLRGYVEELIDGLVKKPVADLATDFTYPLTTLAGFSLLGFPLEDTELLRSWCGKRVLLTYGDLPVDEQVIAARNLVDFWDYARKFVARRQQEPADDLTTDLLRMADQGVDGLEVEDVINMVYSIALASHETTASGILNGMRQLLARRDDWNALIADPSIIPNAVEELMRFDSPTITHRRLTTRDTEVGGVPIPAGATVVLLFGAANRDPRHFDNPETLDLRRPNAGDQLAFGKFWHLCLGAPLARFEYALTLERLTARTPHMRLVENQTVDYLPIILFRAPSGLLVEPMGDARRAPTRAATSAA